MDKKQIIEKKAILKIKVSHSDPEVERKAVESIKNLINVIAEALGEEKPKYFETEEEAKAELKNNK